MNVEIGTEAAQFREKEYLNRIFEAVYEGTLEAWFTQVKAYSGT
jgi:hypothetical protein